MYFLIDTNIFLNMLKEAKDEFSLNTLEAIIIQDKITLLVPEILQKEWTRKKGQTLTQLQKKIKETENITGRTGESLPSMQQLKDRARRIDGIIAAGKPFKLTQKVKAATIDVSLEKKAPFHGDKTKSINDALFFFSAVSYLKRKKIDSIYFITSDRDFTDEAKTEPVLHRDLLQPGITINYYNSLARCFSYLQQVLGNAKEATEKNLNYQLKVIEKNPNILAYVYDVLKFLKARMEFTPTELLIRIEPFRIRDIKHPYTNYSLYSLATNNKDLINLFQQIDFRNAPRFKQGTAYKNTKKNLEQLQFITRTLQENLVHHISMTTGVDYVSIELPELPNCDCPTCLINRLEIARAIKALAADTDKDRLKIAQAYFNLGVYHKAFLIYYENYKAHVANHDLLKSYIELFRLKWSNNILWRAEQTETKSMKTEVDLIDTEERYFQFAASSEFEKQVASLFFQNNVLRSYAESIAETLDKIRDHYRIQLGAGHSSNSNLNRLINLYQELTEYVFQNRLPYTKFTEFATMTAQYMEGLFLSYAMNSRQSSRLEAITSGLLKQLLLFGNADLAVTFFNRFIQQKIRYEIPEGSGDFETATSNYLEHHNDTYPLIDQLSKASWEARDNYFRYFWNILALLSIVDMPQTFIKACGKNILGFLPDISYRDRSRIHHVASFIKSWGPVMGKQWLQKVLQAILDNKELHQFNILSAFSELTEKSRDSYITTDKMYRQLLQLFGEADAMIRGENENALFDLYQAMDKKYRTSLASYIDNLLAEKFNHELFYRACIYDIIKPEPSAFEKYLSCFERPDKNTLGRNQVFDEVETMPGLNSVINLSLKYKLPLPAEFIIRFKGLSDYYDWLLDMDSFDYALFDPLWILSYNTRYYLAKAFSQKQVVGAVKKYVKTNPHPKLAKYFVLYTQRAD